MKTNVDNVGSRLTFFLSVVGNFFSRFVGSDFNIFRFRRWSVRTTTELKV